jgi:hypothetical protein
MCSRGGSSGRPTRRDHALHAGTASQAGVRCDDRLRALALQGQFSGGVDTDCRVAICHIWRGPPEKLKASRSNTPARDGRGVQRALAAPGRKRQYRGSPRDQVRLGVQSRMSSLMPRVGRCRPVDERLAPASPKRGRPLPRFSPAGRHSAQNAVASREGSRKTTLAAILGSSEDRRGGEGPSGRRRWLRRGCRSRRRSRSRC